MQLIDIYYIINIILSGKLFNVVNIILKSCMYNLCNKKNLEKLKSNIVYSKFENDKWNCTDHTFYSNIIGDANTFHTYKHIFQKLLNALCYVYRKKVYVGNFDSDLCSYMYYWIGDKIYDISDSTQMFTKIMDMLFWEFNITDNGMICQSLNTSIDKDTFKKNKMLYEYSQNHESIRLHTLPINTTCDSEYNETMQKYMNIYKNAHFDCTQGDQTNYDCSYFHKLFKSDEHMKLTSLYCRQQNTPTLSTETHEGHQEEEDNIFPIPTREQYPKSVTPVGGFINKLLGRNMNMHNNIENMDMFNPYSDEMDPGGRRMNISYHRF
ncbi:hypothetical protein PVMG_06197 [Plasmodium vivax Mauritania I]|uniref:Variable surface protein n=1 Tax=Plasmodium vivax Mauritania I TaxID=1035515 RepID=A0A0J9TI94_PLAVI|nr:hypothetical protein PVMG_06197 [Plasmodium vivax Mauritania I]